MNPKKSFDMYHIWLAPRHIVNVPTLIVTCTTVADLEHQIVDLKPPNVQCGPTKTSLMVHAVDAIQMLPLLI